MVRRSPRNRRGCAGDGADTVGDGEVHGRRYCTWGGGTEEVRVCREGTGKYVLSTIAQLQLARRAVSAPFDREDYHAIRVEGIYC